MSRPVTPAPPAQLYFEVVKPGEEVSVEFSFTPNPLLTPTEFTVALTVFYEDLKGGRVSAAPADTWLKPGPRPAWGQGAPGAAVRPWPLPRTAQTALAR
jgi:hypothetical protein